ncbi:MAG: Flp pilus assembly complex ATPase component TadA [Nanoarchaeota archaeon]|nr:Flp pilus assembly complex ATPase component TadA [Nanoarchaeota archaeon]
MVFEIEVNDGIMRMNCIGSIFGFTLEDSDVVMARVIGSLIVNKKVTDIILAETREYEYDTLQTTYLKEIAEAINKIIKEEKLISIKKIGSKSCEAYIPKWYSWIQDLMALQMRGDPIGAYLSLTREIRHLKTKMMNSSEHAECIQYFLENSLLPIQDILDECKLIQIARPSLTAYHAGDRTIYRRIFKPTIRPNFMYTKYMSQRPEGELIEKYSVGDSKVEIYRIPGKIRHIYHVIPPEFKLGENEYTLLDGARRILEERRPKELEITEQEKMRELFYTLSVDLLTDLSDQMDIPIGSSQITKLSGILTRYTAGLGIIELLLADNKIEDIYINSPLGNIPIYINHQDYGECETNLVPTKQDAERWSTRFKLLSGRPLDEANPVLDTELMVPGGIARVAAINPKLSPDGLGFALRRHRDNPWTFPLFIDTRYFDPLFGGLMWFTESYGRTFLVAGTRSSGKSSLLGSMMLQILPYYRMITVEDTLELPVSALRKLGYNIQRMKSRSVITKIETELPAEEALRTALRLGDSCLFIGEVRSSLRGDQEVVVVDKGITKRLPIKDFENIDIKSFNLPTLTKDNKVELKPLSGFVKHPKRKKLIKIITNSGREVVVTPDHSVFTHVNFKIAAINSDKLKAGDPIIIPSKIPCGFNDIDYINLLEIFKEDYRLENAEPYIRKAIKVLGWKNVSKICKIPDIYRYLLSTQKTRIPINSFLELMEKAKIKYDINNLRIKRGTSNSIPARFPINENTLRLIGYYLAEGNIDKNKIQITNSKAKIIEDIKDICKKELGLKISQRQIKGYGTSVQMFICCKPLSDLFIYLGCGKTSFHKRIPQMFYGLNKRKICSLLRGMYSGDGSFSATKNAGDMIRYFSTSKKLVEDVAYALLCLEIVCRLHSREPGKKGKRILYTAEIKKRRYIECFLNEIGFTHKNPLITSKSFSHSKDDSVSFDPKELENHLKLPRKYRHLRKTKCCSKDYLKKITEEVKCSDELHDFAHGDFFVDKVKFIDVINLKKPEYVYDLEVKSTQRFIGGFGGLLLHNTEAKALYEAMRIGALANVVAGTIHGESAYGVFDRVVNDLGVPPTSFKATDFVVVCNRLKTADGVHNFRRVVELTEVRKHWTKDPAEEGGFVNLMEYSSEEDKLKPTDTLLNGESYILNELAKRVPGWAGRWNLVWENIQLRADILEKMVEISRKTGNRQLLEAPVMIKTNQMFHQLSNESMSEVGKVDPKIVFNSWLEWFKKQAK